MSTRPTRGKTTAASTAGSYAPQSHAAQGGELDDAALFDAADQFAALADATSTTHPVAFPDVQITLDVPDGYLHMKEVKERGWTRDEIEQFLPEATTVAVPDTRYRGGSISPRTWRVEDVDAAEAGEPMIAHRAAVQAEREVAAAAAAKKAERVAKAAAKAATRLIAPIDGPATDLVSSKQLKARGWTDKHIKECLGEAEHTEQRPNPYARGYYHVDYYDRRRVDHAEANDELLRKQLDRHNANREKKIADKVASGVVVFRKHNDTWAIFGADLTTGALVTVTKKTGGNEEVYVTGIIAQNDDGVLARFERKVERDQREARAARAGAHCPRAACRER